MMRYELPEADEEVLTRAQEEYTAAQVQGGARLREAEHGLAWAYVHAKDKSKIQVGIDLAEQILLTEGADQREAKYFVAVGLYRRRQFLKARTQISSILETWPNFKQAEELKSLIEDGIVKDGLIGLGIGLGAAAAAGLGVVAAAVFSKR